MRTVKFGICNELFVGWPLAQTMRFVAGLGYQGLELAPFTLGAPMQQLSASWRQKVRQEAEQLGLEIIGLHWLLAQTQGLHLTHPDSQVRQQTADYLTGLAELCADLGGQVMVFGSPQQRSLLPGVTRAQAECYAQDTLRRCLDRLQALGVTLCLEPLGRNETDFVNTVEEAICLISALDHPALRLQLDVKAMAAQGGAIPTLIRQSAPFASHFHANDGQQGPGFGSLGFASIMGALLDVGYDRFVSVEVFDSAPGPETIAKRSIACLREALARAADRRTQGNSMTGKNPS